jgi:hypothetical protein
MREWIVSDFLRGPGPVVVMPLQAAQLNPERDNSEEYGRQRTKNKGEKHVAHWRFASTAQVDFRCRLRCELAG